MRDADALQVFILFITSVVIPVMFWFGKKYLDKSIEAAKDNVRDLGVKIDRSIVALGNQIDGKERDALEKFLDVEKKFGAMPENFVPRREMDVRLKELRSGQERNEQTMNEIKQKVDHVHESNIEILTWIRAKGKGGPLD